MAVVRDIGVETVRQLGVKVTLSDASGTAKSLLELLEYTVKGKLETVISKSSMTSKEEEGDGSKEQVMVYYITRTTQQSALLRRLLPGITI
ncbi:hypothetical protein DSM106972_009230 [Dulcicalothrix desertica PCC 7102]|uniref:Uncharacterized protein n=1 Tax=Dulcicalothrix desertica PCC 7102 TaxID=232991 RepID=A0A433VRX2_9CYAN|nr:hypothetical protein [Dulcicalothrix desertica]RUT08870.1 hypothetical protein DSM106972_009230 [Dulcicalothrix desertica PCC 7102]TWH44114.1 hypothetical protein CAL7102_07892 [Dulcicalothrix desertica PCC 7102]